MKLQRVLRFGAKVAIGAAVALAGSLPTQAGESPGTIAGVWIVQVTPRNCTTGAAAGMSIAALLSFHEGRTISESVANLGFHPNQRSEGHGVWRKLGRGQFSQEIMALIRFDSIANLPGQPGFDPSQPTSPGYKTGSVALSQAITLRDRENFDSSGTVEFFDAAGVSYRKGCSTQVGRRFE